MGVRGASIQTCLGGKRAIPERLHLAPSCFAVALLLCAFGAVSLQGEEGLSRNIGGFAKTTIPSNSVVLVSIPFVRFDGSGAPRSIPAALEEQLVGGGSFLSSDAIWQYDAVAEAYTYFWKTSGTNGEWRKFPEVTETTNTLGPGQGFFISSKQTNAQDFYAIGELPAAGTWPTSTTTLRQGSEQAAFAYPAGMGINEMTLTNVYGGATGDYINAWDIAGQDYVGYFYDIEGTNGGGWQLVDTPGSPSPRVWWASEAFWFNHLTNIPSTNTVWTEAKPYTWP